MSTGSLCSNSVAPVQPSLETLVVEERRRGISFSRFFTESFEPGKTPYDEVLWELRNAEIKDETGSKIFEQADVQVPSGWSQTATNIVSNKYLHGRTDSPERERSVAQLIHRVVDTISDWGLRTGYFATKEDGENFRFELAHLMLTQKACFNSPVWFNVGVKREHSYGFWFDEERGGVRKSSSEHHHPQCSACFINSVEDSLESVLELVRVEGMLFKGGSGTGTNLSSLRENGAPLNGPGSSPGPLGFMKGYDVFAGVIKSSGGISRRAAKMVILNVDHPDIEQFVSCKSKEEGKVQALIGAGYDASLDGDAYKSIFFQNANLSVRVSDEFMQAVVGDLDWWTRSVVTGRPAKRLKARELMRQIAEMAHHCGDPGVQFDTTINHWHTCKSSGRINASNPCSEYMFLDDSACNLASINLLKFLQPDGTFDIEGFRHTVNTMVVAQDIIVGQASYPTEKIAMNSYEFRPLGLGYANLGALLMALGIPYDSDEGRAYAAGITATMSGQAYLTSATIAHAKGACRGYLVNQESFLDVIKAHWKSLSGINREYVSVAIYNAAEESWRQAYEAGSISGFRNAQTTVLAPTGTIGFMMDCDTTGIEPDLALVKSKKLVGGGLMTLVNNTVPRSLTRLGYTKSQVQNIVSHIEQTGTIEGAPNLKPEHLAVFDCSFRANMGKRFIHHTGHIKMMAAVQPFLSGAISKTINMPEDSTVENIIDAYIESWRLGLKSVAVYRNGSKRVQPLNGKSDSSASPVTGKDETKTVGRSSQKLPDERQAIAHSFRVAGCEGCIIVGLHESGRPREVMISMPKAGSTISGLMHVLSISMTCGLQHGVPLDFFVDKFSHVRFEPSGWTNNMQLPHATSLIDYIGRWLGKRFLNKQDPIAATIPLGPLQSQGHTLVDVALHSPLCCECGNFMCPSGSCYRCDNCGITSSCG